MLQQNPPIDRLRYIAKQYEKYPVVTFSMIDIIAHTVGEDGWKATVSDAVTKAMRDAYLSDDSAEINSAERASRLIGKVVYSTTEPLFTSLKDQVAEITPVLVEMTSELRGFKERNQSEGTFAWMAKQLSEKAKPVVLALQKVKISDREPIPRQITEEAREYVEAVRFFKTRGTAIGQWAAKEKPKLMQMSFDDVKDAVEDFDSDGKKPPTQHPVFHDFGDGWTVQELPGTYCEEEKDAMQHCGRARERDSTLYSIRDPRGYPHVTIEWNENQGKAIQIFGKQNKKPAPKYQKYVDALFESGKLEVRKLPKELQDIIDALRDSPGSGDMEEEYEESYAHGWQDAVGDAEQVKEWLLSGLSYSDYETAGALVAEDVTPDEFDDFPWAVTRAVSDSQARIDDLVAIGRIAVALSEAPRFEGRDLQLPLPSVPMERAEKDFQARKKASSLWKWIEFTLNRSDSLDQFVFPAEDWIATDFIKTDPTFEYEDVKEWVKYGFTPDQAAAWMTESAADSMDTELTPKTIRTLVDRGITPEDIADMDVNEKTDAVDVIDYLRSRGIEKNRKRRTSRETR